MHLKRLKSFASRVCVLLAALFKAIISKGCAKLCFYKQKELNEQNTRKTKRRRKQHLVTLTMRAADRASKRLRGAMLSEPAGRNKQPYRLLQVKRQGIALRFHGSCFCST